MIMIQRIFLHFGGRMLTAMVIPAEPSCGLARSRPVISPARLGMIVMTVTPIITAVLFFGTRMQTATNTVYPMGYRVVGDPRAVLRLPNYYRWTIAMII